MPAPSALDTTRCPLCGQANRCAVEIERETGVAQAPCWCLSARFTDALRQCVPAEARGVACICAHCANAATTEESLS